MHLYSSVFHGVVCRCVTGKIDRVCVCVCVCRQRLEPRSCNGTQVSFFHLPPYLNSVTFAGSVCILLSVALTGPAFRSANNSVDVRKGKTYKKKKKRRAHDKATQDAVSFFSSLGGEGIHFLKLQILLLLLFREGRSFSVPLYQQGDGCVCLCVCGRVFKTAEGDKKEKERKGCVACTYSSGCNQKNKYEKETRTQR